MDNDLTRAIVKLNINSEAGIETACEDTRDERVSFVLEMLTNNSIYDIVEALSELAI